MGELEPQPAIRADSAYVGSAVHPACAPFPLASDCRRRRPLVGVSEAWRGWLTQLILWLSLSRSVCSGLHC